jgi:HEAT repeat protein
LTAWHAFSDKGNTMKDRIRWTMGVVLAVALMSGCGPKKKQVRMNRPPEMPPPAPAKQAVALDPALQAAAKQEIATAATSNQPILRAHAIEAMKDTTGADAAPTFLKGLTDNSALVRFAACMATGELRLSQAKDALLVCSDDTDGSVRIGAKFALHRLGDTRQSRDLESAARDPRPRVRGDTALVLGLLGEPTAVRILKPMLYDPSPAVRLQAAESLWRLGDQQGLEALVSASLSKFPDDQMLAILALATPKDHRVLGHIQGQLTNDYIEVSLIAARAAGMLGSDEGYGVALKGSHSTDPRQRMLAALAFGSIGRADSQSSLSVLLRDSNQDVRIAAATAILQLKAT